MQTLKTLQQQQQQKEEKKIYKKQVSTLENPPNLCFSIPT